MIVVARPFLHGPQLLVEQLQNPPVFVRPARLFRESMVFDRIHGELPVLLSQLDQPLRQPHRILEVHVRVDHAVADQQRAFQPLGKVDRRALAIGLSILLRNVEDVRRVAVVVVRPVGYRPQRRAGREDVRRREHRHQRDEAAIAPAVDANAPRIHLLLRRQVLRAVDDVLEILAAHVPVDRRPPVAPVAGARPVVDVEHDIAAGCQQVVEHVLAEIRGPVAVGVLQIPGAVDEDDARPRRIAPRADHLRREQPRMHVDAVTRLERDDLADRSTRTTATPRSAWS